MFFISTLLDTKGVKNVLVLDPRLSVKFYPVVSKSYFADNYFDQFEMALCSSFLNCFGAHKHVCSDAVLGSFWLLSDLERNPSKIVFVKIVEK